MAQLRASVVYEPRSDTTPEAEVKALANVYRFILDCHAKKMAAEPTPESGGRDVASITNGKEVSDVDRRPYKPSEIVVTNSRKLRTQ
jgi:hypothetical protein